MENGLWESWKGERFADLGQEHKYRKKKPHKNGAEMSSQEISIYLAKFRFNLWKAHCRSENGGEGS